MNSRLLFRYDARGFGLVEVLVTIVIVAGGLLAVSSLQSSLMSSSGDEKARSEATKLAEQKIEEMRNYAMVTKPCNRPIQSSDYANIVSSTSAQSVDGINATYSVSWVITEPATGPDRRNVAVTVTWGQNESVRLDSEISLIDLCNVSTLATGGNGGSGIAPSPNNVSSDISDVKFNSSEISETALNDGTGLSEYMDATTGDIYLLEAITADGDGNDRKALIKFQGGIVLSIKGAVYHGTVGNGSDPAITLTPTTDYPVAFSDMAYCVFPVPNTDADYICYFGGDCQHGGDGCPATSYEYKAVLGGWYGKVGLIETESANFQNKKVCFGEDVNGQGIETAVTTARTYLTRRVDANSNVIGTEGINQSFSCQNFLVVDKKGSSYPCAYFKDFLIPDANNNLAVAGSVVARVLTPEQSNTVQAIDFSQCGSTCSYVVTGVISGNARDNTTVTINTQSCTKSSEDDFYTYSCSIETTEETATITAVVESEGGSVSPASQTISLACGTSEIAGAELITSGGDNFCMAPWGDLVADGGSVTAYQTASVPSESECVSQTRVCDNGTLSGEYTFQVCEPASVSSCTAPWGDTVGNGSSVTAYELAQVGPSQSCQSEQRICASGVLSGTYNYQTCTVGISECDVTVNGIIIQGAKQPLNSSVNVESNPGGECTKKEAGGNYTYSCAVGTVADGSSVTISGKKVTGGGTVQVDCQSPQNDEGPTLTTTN